MIKIKKNIIQKMIKLMSKNKIIHNNKMMKIIINSKTNLKKMTMFTQIIRKKVMIQKKMKLIIKKKMKVIIRIKMKEIFNKKMKVLIKKKK